MESLISRLIEHARTRAMPAPAHPLRLQIGAATLMLADCATVLSDLAGVDAIVTEPPVGFSATWVCCGKDGSRHRYLGDRMGAQLGQVMDAHPGWRTVLDPFMGPRCAAGVAALRAGRRFIGIEIDATAFAAAHARLAQEF